MVASDRIGAHFDMNHSRSEYYYVRPPFALDKDLSAWAREAWEAYD